MNELATRRPLHLWRIYANANCPFEVPTAIARLVRSTETEPMDHMIEDGFSIWSGRNPLPPSPFLIRSKCSYCPNAWSIGCWWCCETGTHIRWSTPYNMEDVVKGLQLMIQEMKGMGIV